MKIPNTPFSTDGKKNWKRRGKNSKLACQNEIHDRETECVCVRMRVCERDCYPTRFESDFRFDHRRPLLTGTHCFDYAFGPLQRTMISLYILHRI